MGISPMGSGLYMDKVAALTKQVGSDIDRGGRRHDLKGEQKYEMVSVMRSCIGRCVYRKFGSSWVELRSNQKVVLKGVMVDQSGG
jgi:hypothetical protein